MRRGAVRRDSEVTPSSSAYTCSRTGGMGGGDGGVLCTFGVCSSIHIVVLAASMTNTSFFMLGCLLPQCSTQPSSYGSARPLACAAFLVRAQFFLLPCCSARVSLRCNAQCCKAHHSFPVLKCLLPCMHSSPCLAMLTACKLATAFLCHAALLPW